MSPIRRLPRTLCIAIFAGGAVLSACGAAGAGGSSDNGAAVATGTDRSLDLVDVLRANDLTSAASAVEAIGLDALTAAGEFTFFVPNDDAFLALGADEIADLFEDGDRLIDVMRNHVVDERMSVADLIGGGMVTTESGAEWQVGGQTDDVTVGNAHIVVTDIEVGPNGIVHVIDRLLGS